MVFTSLGSIQSYFRRFSTVFHDLVLLIVVLGGSGFKSITFEKVFDSFLILLSVGFLFLLHLKTTMQSWRRRVDGARDYNENADVLSVSLETINAVAHDRHRLFSSVLCPINSQTSAIRTP